jgi:hypothetical protein
MVVQKWCPVSASIVGVRCYPWCSAQILLNLPNGNGSTDEKQHAHELIDRMAPAPPWSVSWRSCSIHLPAPSPVLLMTMSR